LRIPYQVLKFPQGSFHNTNEDWTERSKLRLANRNNLWSSWCQLVVCILQWLNQCQMFPMEVNSASIRCWQGRLEVTPEGLAQDQGFFVRNLRSVCLGGSRKQSV